MVLAGGFAPILVNAEIRRVTAAVEALALEAKAFPEGKPPGLMAKLDPWDEFIPVDAVSQVVAGIRYFVKVRVAHASGPMMVGGQRYVMLGIFVALDGAISLTHFKEGVGMGEQAGPFGPALPAPLTTGPATIEPVTFEPQTTLGGWAPTPINAEMKAMTQSVRTAALEARAFPNGKPFGLMAKLKPFDMFEPLEAVCQVVAGMKYFVKVQVATAPPGLLGGDDYVMLGIFKSLTGVVTLTHFEDAVTAIDRAGPFGPPLPPPAPPPGETLVIDPLPIAGGLTEWNQMAPEAAAIAMAVKADAGKQIGAFRFSKYDPLRYKTQVVAGTIYIIEVAAAWPGASGVLTLRVLKPLMHAEALRLEACTVGEGSAVGRTLTPLSFNPEFLLSMR